MQYSCYITGIKKHFRTIGLNAKQIVKIEKLIDQSDTKRADVRRIYIKYTKDQPLGYKLEKMAVDSAAVKSPINKMKDPIPL